MAGDLSLRRDGRGAAGRPACALACCVAAHHVALAAPVLLAFGIAWDDPIPADRFPPAIDESPARAPPDTHASPRGPPQA